MDKKEIVVGVCVGVVLWDAVEFAVTGEKPALPAGQPHIHVAVSTGSIGALSFPVLGAVTTSGTTSSVSTSSAFQILPPSTLWTNCRCSRVGRRALARF